jgi:hypothetical protein
VRIGFFTWPTTPYFVRVRGTDAAPRGAEAIVSSRLFLELVEERVVAHDHVRAFADDQVLRLDPTLLELGDLAQQHDRVDHHPVADDADAFRIEDARGDQLELELAVLGDDGVACVVAAL